MTTRTTESDPSACAAFQERLGAWLEGELADAEQAAMERHRARCAACAALVADLDAIVHEAGTLPPLAPSRDLWSGIEARLEAPVIALPLRRAEAAAGGRSRTVNVRLVAAAAAVLVAVSSGITWRIARSVPAAKTATTATTAGTSAPSVASAAPSVAPDSALGARQAAVTSEAPGAGTSEPAARQAARPGGTARTASRAVPTAWEEAEDLDRVYEREIVALRRIVNERFAELDTATVNALRRNLDIIDQAIADSRKALVGDPNSALLSTQLDRTLEAKLALMRRVALL